MTPMKPSPRHRRLRVLGLGLALSIGAFAAGCYGPKRVTFVDSSRAGGGASHDGVASETSSPVDKCGAAGIARVETHTTWINALFSFGGEKRHADVVCAKGAQ